jgi:hypothetical protein
MSENRPSIQINLDNIKQPIVIIPNAFLREDIREQFGPDGYITVKSNSLEHLREQLNSIL